MFIAAAIVVLLLVLLFLLCHYINAGPYIIHTSYIAFNALVRDTLILTSDLDEAVLILDNVDGEL